MIKIIDILIKDIRFPTSKTLDGSDAMNVKPNYSATYVILKTNDYNYFGHGLLFTIGRGNEICVAAVHALKHLIIGCKLEDIIENMGEWCHYLNNDSQLRWLGPEKGVIHMASAALINAIWDLWGKYKKKPVWLLLADMSPEKIIKCIDFKYITDVIKPDEALQSLENKYHSRDERKNYLLKNGYPAYITSCGWLGYSDDKLKFLCKKAINDGWKYIKIKVGYNLEDDIRRLNIVRNTIGKNCKLMIDANQMWDVDQAIEWINHLKQFDIWWIEEPTNPDDVIGHSKIRDAIHPIKIATGEHCQNRILFKQFMQSKAIDICQIDSCRLASVNEILSVLLMANKFSIPVCPHAGGVGLCEYVQHLSAIDYICISGSIKNRVIEYVDHLHDHFKYPVIIKNGAYIIPDSPGYSIEMKKETLLNYDFNNGKIWKN
jgi:L-fuconate dehydratase